MAITHAFVSAKSDGADATKVQPSNWNDDHVGSLPLTIPVITKTAGYTTVAGDLGSEINFTTAGATLTLLAAATAGNGATQIVRNSAPSGDVTIDPNSAETLDGLATRLLRPGDCVLIRCDGSVWRTISGDYSYDSGDQTITSAGLLTLAHGLGVKPVSVEVVLRCDTAENNFSINDEISVSAFANTGTGFSTNRGIALEKDATNLTIRYGSGAAVFGYVNGTSGAEVNLTNANWRMIVRARAA